MKGNIRILSLLIPLTLLVVLGQPLYRTEAAGDTNVSGYHEPLQTEMRLLERIPDILYLISKEGLIRVSESGIEILNGEISGNTLTLVDHRIYTGCGPIYELSLEGKILREIYPKAPYCVSTTPMPQDRFAVLDNKNDWVYVVDSNGSVLNGVNLTREPGPSLQNMYGIVVGSKLVVSEDGEGRIVSVDLKTYEVSVFKGMSGDKFRGPITYSNGVFYACSSSKVYSFTESGPVRIVTDRFFDNPTGIAVAGDRLYLTRSNEIYMISLSDGSVRKIAEGFTGIRDIEIIPGEVVTTSIGQSVSKTETAIKPATTEVVTITVEKVEGGWGSTLDSALIALIAVLAAIVIYLFYFKKR
ncbi:MAG: hypothetical protein QI199_01165 [Candidatus Korarchaeota archaeon]|nr:hypothetical protein [Candidatus Korarchaeota archaeon]